MSDFTKSTEDIFRAVYNSSGALQISGQLQSVLGTGLSYSGSAVSDIVAGEALTAADLTYLKSDGKWYRANATTTVTMGMLGMAMTGISASATGNVAVEAFVKNTAWTFTPGAIIYGGVATGTITTSLPLTTDMAIQVVGYAVASNTIYFAPSVDYMVKA